MGCVDQRCCCRPQSAVSLTPYNCFTEEEVERLAEQYHQNFDEVKRWYDGYLGYDQYTRTAFIPNEEIRQELTMAVEPQPWNEMLF